MMRLAITLVDEGGRDVPVPMSCRPKEGEVVWLVVCMDWVRSSMGSSGFEMVVRVK